MAGPHASAVSERLGILRSFVTARWLRRFTSGEELDAWQERQLADFLGQVAAESSFYRDLPPRLDAWPLMDKAAYRRHFSELNPCGVPLAESEEFALAAESTRDFTAELRPGISVGLSSGTSGQRGIFLASGDDRRRWAGIAMARILSAETLRQLVTPWRPGLKIAFFLRANSNLYRTLGGRRLEFRYFDLLRPLPTLAEEVQDYRPDILIAPATVLAGLARQHSLKLHPQQIVSVAEVLDPPDAALIEAKFGVRPDNVYQATEGFLASTCSTGSLHLNEEFLHIGREWLDEARTRFHPIVTDFTRKTQWIIRYRLDDILIASSSACSCGRATRVIAAVEGRSDEVLRFGGPLFPDVLRQAFYSLPQAPGDYRIEQHGLELHVALGNSSPGLEGAISTALMQLFQSQRLIAPEIRFLPWHPQPPAEKQRRIRCITPLPTPQ